MIYHRCFVCAGSDNDVVKLYDLTSICDQVGWLPLPFQYLGACNTFFPVLPYN